MPSYDAPDVWKLKFSEKRALFAKHRVAVGGQAPEGADASDGGMALFFWSGPPAYTLGTTWFWQEIMADRELWKNVILFKLDSSTLF